MCSCVDIDISSRTPSFSAPAVKTPYTDQSNTDSFAHYLCPLTLYPDSPPACSCPWARDLESDGGA